MPPLIRKRKTRESLPEKAVEIKAKVDCQNHKISINRLPFDCFFLIFRRIDIRTQILVLRSVCHAWHDHITQICASRRHLKLEPYYNHKFKNFPLDLFFLPDLRQYPKNLQRRDYLEFRLSKIAKFTAKSSLFRLFATHLTDLNLTFDSRNWARSKISVAKFIKLMKSFSAFSSLRTLSLGTEPGAICFKDNNQLIKILESLYKAIGGYVTREKLPKLTQLHLKIDLAQNSETEISDLEMHLDPHILSQLEHFSMDFYTRNVPALMGQLNPGLTFLSFNCELLSDLELEPALLGESKFAPNLTHLRLNKIWTVPLKLFCDRFMALQSVQLKANFDPENFDEEWIKPLNQLEQLMELRLHGFKISIIAKNFDKKSSCLSSVKKLTWYYPSLLHEFYCKYCDGQFDHDLFCRTVAGQFTNLEELAMLTADSKENAQLVRDHLYHFKKLRSNLVNFDVYF